MTLRIGRGAAHVSAAMLRTLVPLATVTIMAITVPCGVYLFVVWPSDERLAVADAAYQAARQEKVRLEQQRSAQLQARSARQSLKEVWNTLPVQQEFTGLALAVSELGRTEGVLIPGMGYALKPVKDAASPIEATLSFQARGQYTNLYRFIHRLEHQPTYLLLDRLDVRREGQGKAGSRPVVAFQVTLTTFLRPSTATGA